MHFIVLILSSLNSLPYNPLRVRARYFLKTTGFPPGDPLWTCSRKLQRKNYSLSPKALLIFTQGFALGKVGLLSSTDSIAIYMSTGECERSEQILSECLDHVDHPEERAKLMRLRSMNFWLRKNYMEAIRTILSALELLEVHIGMAPTREEADEMFEEVSIDILTLGRDAILNLPRASDSKVDLAVALLNDAGKFHRPYSDTRT